MLSDNLQTLIDESTIECMASRGYKPVLAAAPFK